MSDKLIYKQMASIMGKVPAIGKDSENKQQGYKFRGIDEVYNVLHSILAEHRVFPMPEVLSENRGTVQTANGKTMMHTTVTVKYTFYAEDGSNVSCVMIGEGMDMGDKSGNKAVAGAEKYAFVQIFCIPTSEPKDSENDSPEVAPEPVKDATHWKDEADKNTNHIKNLKAWYAKHKDEIKKMSVKEQDSVNLYVKVLGEKLEEELKAKKEAEADPTLAADYEQGKGE
jgi:hypothetical protein